MNVIDSNERFRGRILRVLALLSCVAVVAAACGGAGASSQGNSSVGGSSAGQASGTGSGTGTGGTLTIAMSAGDIPRPSVSPDQGYEGYRFVGNNIYDALTRLNLDQTAVLPTPQPSLAQSWSLSANKLTWTFHLRPGVTFQDGSPFNADAVIFNFDRDTQKTFQYYDASDAASNALYFLHIASFAKVDESTIQIKTVTPYALLPDDLLTIYIASPTAVKTYGNANYNQHAIGTGPFKMTKYIDGQVMELTANKSYWGGAPKLDKIILYPLPEPASRVAALESGQVNWAEVPSPDSLGQLQSQGYQIFMENNHPGAIMPEMNMFRPPLNNLMVREALNYALDRKGTVALIDNTGLPANQYVYPGHPNYVVGDPGYYYDPAKAKALLAQAGYGPGGKKLKLTFAYPTSGSGNMFPGPMMEKLQADFKAVGVGVTLMPMEWDSLISVIFDGLKNPKWSNIDILWSSPAAGMLPTGYEFSDLCTFAGGLPNPAGYCDPKVDALFNQASATFDLKQQNQLLTQMNKIVLQDAPFLFWVYDRNLRVMSPSVHGYIAAQSWWVDFTKVWVGK
jgi:peptide/nickel transport system substrate-binding protein